MSSAGSSPKVNLRGVIALFALFSFLVVVAGHLYYQREVELIRREKYQGLQAIAQEKARFVTAWLMARAKEAARPARSPFFRKALEEWLKDPKELSRLEGWKARFRMDREDFGYDDLILLDKDGWSVLLSAKEDPDPIDPFTHEAVKKAREYKGPALSEPYICPKGTIHLDAVCPVYSLEGELMAFFVLRSDLGESLFPLLQSWPTPSPSAETLIVKQEGNQVIFINQLRHRSPSALSLGVPIHRRELPAVQAVMGRTGMFLGRDYRGVEVLADLRQVSGTSWFMVTKVDADEILEEARYRGIVTAVFVGLALFLFASLAALWVRHGRARLWKKLYSSERELRVARESFRAVLYSIGDAVIVTSKQGNVEMMNPVAEALTGWREDEAKGRPLEEVFRILNEQNREPMESPVERVLREGLVVGLANHTLLLSKDGTERPIADSAAPIRDENGELTGVVLVFRDQSEDRERQKELERSRREWEQIFQAVGHPTIILDPEFRILEANKEALEMSGLGKDQLLGKKCYQVFHSSGEPPGECPCMSLMKQDHTKAPSVVEQTEGGRTYLVSCTPIRNEKGILEKVIHVATDVTQLQETQEALLESQEKFRSLVENATQGILVVQEERIPYANPEALRLFGASMEEVLKAHYLDFTHPEDRELIADRYRRRKLGETVSGVVEFRLVDLSGDIKWVSAHTAQILWEGRPAYLVFLQDLSHQKNIQAEREKLEAQFLQAQKMEAVGRLAGGVAHDFNNMLSVVSGYAELALSAAQGDKLLENYLGEIQGSVKKSASLVRQLLAFARKQVISPSPLDLNEAISNMLKMLKRLIGEDIELVWIPGHEIWTVYLDPAQLDQILANLLVNARDAIPGTGKVTIETQNAVLDQDYSREHPGFVPGEYVMLAVTDDGCGMDKETLEMVFEPFFTTKGLDKGTGLGLSTVYGIVKQNRGFINVYSEPGEGTTFKIYLPRHKAVKPAQEVGSPASESLPRGTETVLLVEDDVALIKVYTKFLETLGYKVLPSSSPHEAIELAMAHQGEIQLLLTDVVMPGMSGKELWGILREHYPWLRCLFMSGYTANAIVHHGVLQEGVNFVGKPFTLAVLASKLREVLEAS
jgi:two-component system cell cycle sensor histidine kinase/response regulator CckA